MRSNPLDNTREFNPRRLLVFAGAAVAVLALGGVAAHEVTEARRIGHVRNALIAQGYGEAVVEPIPGDQCWRAAEGFRWKTAAASGRACAGPRDRVEIKRD